MPRHSKAALKLQTTHHRIAATLTERESQLESIIHDNATIRTWADIPLPDAIANLWEHPADAYRQRLPGTRPLPTASGNAQDNGALLLALERIEAAWATCAAKVDTVC